MGEYILKNIECTLDPASIQQAIREIERFRDKLKPAMQGLIEWLSARGVEIARAQLIFFDQPAYDSGALSESIRYEMRGETGYVIAGEGLTNAMGDDSAGSYAVYIEYGNITKHEPGPYPTGGFWYPAPYGWWTPKKGKNAGTPMAWTPGYGPRPFMMNTLHSLEDEAKVDGARVIAEYIRGDRA